MPIIKKSFFEAQRSGQRWIGALYRRTRVENGVKVQRAEVRFDGVAGCLRTPSGGSSRQYILLVEGDKIRSRLLSARETARLMGLPKNVCMFCLLLIALPITSLVTALLRPSFGILPLIY